MSGKSNLFAIDFEAVLRVIAETNAGLVDRHARLMEALERMPDVLDGPEDIDRATRFAGQLQENTKRCRRARLSDTKPLTQLLKQVEQFFKVMEKQSDRAREQVLSKIGEALRRRGDHGDQKDVPPSDAPPTSAHMIIDPATGEVLGEVSVPRADGTASGDAVRMIWHIEGVSREEVDLEALRPYLTDTALLNAARHHLKHHGPHSLKGASYAEKPVLG
jgi:hypothetical protein